MSRLNRRAAVRRGAAWFGAGLQLVTGGPGGWPGRAAAADPGTAAPPPVVGSRNTVTADPPVPRPRTAPTIVPLFTDFTFADFNAQSFAYAPPAALPGPWAKVVFVADFSVTAGRQFDRTAQVTIGNVNVYYGTTAEPSSAVSPSWHVERDVTDDSALLSSSQTGQVYLGNLVNSTYTGILHGSAHLEFYPPDELTPAPRVPDVVLALPAAAGGAASLATTASQLAETFTLPRNVERVYLDVITQSQSQDEFWYTGVPDDVASELQSSPGTAFREAEIAVDGVPAGVAPVYPWIYTGGIDPYLWRPIPGVQALNFAPYRVDLTPFAGLLSDGAPHQIAVSVYNADNYFLATATLLLYLDRASAQVTGAVTDNTVGQPAPVVQENLSTASGYPNGTVSVASDRRFAVAGYVDTSHGRVETRIEQTVRFSNQQQFTISASEYVQDISQQTTVSAVTSRREGGTTRASSQQFNYPLKLKIAQAIQADGTSALTTTVRQGYRRNVTNGPDPFPAVDNGVSNEVISADTLLLSAAGAITGHQDQRSSQRYRIFDVGGTTYQRGLLSAGGVLTVVAGSR